MPSSKSTAGTTHASNDFLRFIHRSKQSKRGALLKIDDAGTFEVLVMVNISRYNMLYMTWAAYGVTSGPVGPAVGSVFPTPRW